MSRSYKKHPYCGDKDKSAKNYANRKVRREEDIFNNSSYKKLFPTWDICDYHSTFTFEAWWEMKVQYWHEYGKQRNQPYPSKKEEYRKWYKFYKMK